MLTKFQRCILLELYSRSLTSVQKGIGISDNRLRDCWITLRNECLHNQTSLVEVWVKKHQKHHTDMTMNSYFSLISKVFAN